MMILSTTDRDIIRNPLHRYLGVGVDKRINEYYVNLIFSQDFKCTKCQNITDAEETNSYWNQYLRDWYKDPDTDGNLRINRQGYVLGLSVGLMAMFLALQ
jgi:hypothetical protein